MKTPEQTALALLEHRLQIIPAVFLSALVGAAETYSADLASGLEDGTYEDEADLTEVEGALEFCKALELPAKAEPSFERAKSAGYNVEPSSKRGFLAVSPAGETLAEEFPTERAAWEACDAHRMFGDKPPVEAYLRRFPEGHRDSANRAYEDGLKDGLAAATPADVVGAGEGISAGVLLETGVVLAHQVNDRWEKGDLAGSVHELEMWAQEVEAAFPELDFSADDADEPAQ